MRFDRGKRLIACNVCKSANLEALLETEAGWWDASQQAPIDRYRFVVDIGVCNDCGHGQVLTALTPQDVSSMYWRVQRDTVAIDSDAFLADIGTRYDHPDLDLLDGHLSAGSRMLDVGCGAGILLAVLMKRHGLARDNLLGVDFATGKRWHFPHVDCDMNDGHAVLGFARQHRSAFNVITSSNFLEHAVDPVGLLRTLSPTLAEGGILMIEVPNSTVIPTAEELLGTSMVHPQHLQYFTKHSLAMALQMSGFEILKHRTVNRLNYQAQQIVGAKRARNSRASARPYLLASKQIIDDRQRELAEAVHTAIRYHGLVGLWGAGTELMQLVDHDHTIRQHIADGSIVLIDQALEGRAVLGTRPVSLAQFLREHPETPLFVTITYAETAASMREQAQALQCLSLVQNL